MTSSTSHPDQIMKTSPGVSNPSTFLLADRYMCLHSVKNGNSMSAFYKTLYFHILQATVEKHKHLAEQQLQGLD